MEKLMELVSASKRLDVMKQWNLEINLPFVHPAKQKKDLNICKNKLRELNGTETKAATPEEKKKKVNKSSTRTKKEVLI